MRFSNLFLLIFFVSLSFSVAEQNIPEKKTVPILDKTTVQKTANSGINKCKGTDESVIYTQFACPERFELIGGDWQENSNLTINHTEKTSFFSLGASSNSPSNKKAPSSATLPFNLENILDPNGELNLKSLSPAEILQQGIKAMMMRSSILDEL